MQSKFDNVPVLNGIRGLAALTVFASHAANIFYQGKWLGAGGGQVGVMVFFMLSGYLMSMLYMSTTPSLNHVGHFFLNRFARIYPMFAFAVIGSFIVANLSSAIYAYDMHHIVDVTKNLFLVTGYGPFWTIGPEIIFYVVFAALWIISYRSRTWLFISISLLLFAGMWPGNSERTNSLIILHQRIPYFIVGMLLGTQHSRIQAWRSTLGASTALIVALILPIIYMACFPNLAVIIHALPKELGPDPSFTMWSYPFYLVAIAFFLIGSILTMPSVLTNRVAVFMGQISFPFYLTHALFLINLAPLLPGHPLRAIALSLFATVILSFLLNVGIEMPCRKLIRRIGSANSAPSGSVG